MALSPGTRLGAYEVVAAIGAGGMGEVYRATDLNLKRTVALKVLPDSVAGDADRLARFQREAEVLAALNHPNIAAIYGLEKSGQVTALVMELVDGPTLEQLIDATPEAESASSRPRESSARQARESHQPSAPGVGPRRHEGSRVPRGLNIDDALRIARQIAEALEAAHEAGIVHRDLKPANIKLKGAWGPTPTRLPDGSPSRTLEAADFDGCTVKVLDFGLAKPRIQETTGANPTMTSPAMTELGMILGTAAYMSPEQAKGRQVDRRADVWAFGAVLYEMVTGARAFPGDEVTEVLASVLAREPDWSKLPADAPAISGVIRRCLERDPRQRFGDMQSVRLALSGALSATPAMPAPASFAVAPASAAITRSRSGTFAWIVAAAATIAAAALGVAYFTRPAPEAPVVKSSILPPPGVAFDFDVTVGPAVISPNGKLIAFSGRDAAGRIQLWVRPIDSTDARPIAGTDGASFPFWSPDSLSLGFYSAGRGRIERVDLAGGAPVGIVRAGYVRGAFWAPDGTVLYDSNESGGQIMEVAIANGTTRPLIKGKNGTPRSPWLLPDGRHFLYVDRGTRQLHVASRDGTTDKPLTDATSHAVYVAGHLIFMRESTLLAQPFDAVTLELKGSPRPIASDVQMLLGDARGVFSVSDTGTLLYLDGASTSPTTLAWFDGKGTRVGTLGEIGSARGVRLSPDGRTAAVGVLDAEGSLNIWTVDLATSSRSQVTFGKDSEAVGAFMIWSPDGRLLAYALKRDGGYAIAQRPAAGGAEETLYGLPADQARLGYPRVTAWTNDKSTILYSGSTLGGIWSLPVVPGASGPRSAKQLMKDPDNAQNIRLAPSERWFSYQGSPNAGSLSQIFVDAYPGGGKPQQVSARGTLALWAPDGKSLYYADDNILTVLSVTEADGALHLGPPRAIMPIIVGRGFSYDVAKDGRILALVTSETRASRPLTLVQNWTR